METILWMVSSTSFFEKSRRDCTIVDYGYHRVLVEKSQIIAILCHPFRVWDRPGLWILYNTIIPSGLKMI